jgi:hypothetical protein
MNNLESKINEIAEDSAESATVIERFCGPPQSGNGGYVCGLAAELLTGYEGHPTQAKVKAPAPLQKKLAVHRQDGSVILLDGDKPVVEAKPSDEDVTIGIPEAPNPDIARNWSMGYQGFKRHFFPSCFVCGPDRAHGDGLRIFCGPGPGGKLVAAPWTPDSSLDNGAGMVAPRYIWAALDCPGGAAALEGREPKLIVLAKFVVELKRPAIIGKEHIVIGWAKKITGRRNLVGSAIFDANRELVAVGEGLWLEATGWAEENKSAGWTE